MALESFAIVIKRHATTTSLMVLQTAKCYFGKTAIVILSVRKWVIAVSIMTNGMSKLKFFWSH